jgi:hypothetical protein
MSGRSAPPAEVLDLPSSASTPRRAARRGSDTVGVPGGLNRGPTTIGKPTRTTRRRSSSVWKYRTLTSIRFPGSMFATFCVKHVGPVLLEQRRDVPLPLRLLVNLLRLLALADDAADPPLAHGHHKLVHRRVVRQGEDVHRFDLAVVGVVELLRDVDGRRRNRRSTP